MSSERCIFERNSGYAFQRSSRNGRAINTGSAIIAVGLLEDEVVQ